MFRISKHRQNLLYSLGLLAILSTFVLLYSGVKEGYFEIFLLAIIVSPMLIIIKPKGNLQVDLFFGVALAIIIVLFAYGFWEYQDRPPGYITDISQVPEELRGGQFSFENPLRLQMLFISSGVSILASLLIRFIGQNFKRTRFNSR